MDIDITEIIIYTTISIALVGWACCCCILRQKNVVSPENNLVMNEQNNNDNNDNITHNPCVKIRT